MKWYSLYCHQSRFKQEHGLLWSFLRQSWYESFGLLNVTKMSSLYGQKSRIGNIFSQITSRHSYHYTSDTSSQSDTHITRFYSPKNEHLLLTKPSHLVIVLVEHLVNKSSLISLL